MDVRRLSQRWPGLRFGPTLCALSRTEADDLSASSLSATGFDMGSSAFWTMKPWEASAVRESEFNRAGGTMVAPPARMVGVAGLRASFGCPFRVLPTTDIAEVSAWSDLQGNPDRWIAGKLTLKACCCISAMDERMETERSRTAVDRACHKLSRHRMCSSLWQRASPSALALPSSHFTGR
jgi:hypothetical protein